DGGQPCCHAASIWSGPSRTTRTEITSRRRRSGSSRRSRTRPIRPRSSKRWFLSSGNTPSSIDLTKLAIRPLDRSMDRAAFCCGEPELDAFFRDHALDHHDGHKARVTVGLYDGKPVGFYWLIAQSFPLN